MDLLRLYAALYGAYVWPILVVVGLAASAALPLLLARWKAFARTRRIRLGWAPACRWISDLPLGELATVEGTLRVKGRGVARVEDGSRVAAVSVSREEESRRSDGVAQAEQLFVELSDGELEIVAELDVLSGSQEYHWEKPLPNLPAPVRERVPAGPEEFVWLTRRGIVSRSVCDGDRVTLRAIVSRREAEAAGYRQPGSRPTLEGAVNVVGVAGRVQLLARSQRYLREHLFWRPIAIGVVTTLLAAGGLVHFLSSSESLRRYQSHPETAVEFGWW